MTPVESEIVMDMLGTCEDPPDFEEEMGDVMEVKVGEHKPTMEPQETVYGSCEEAAAAGEEGCRGAKAEDEGSRRRWCRLPEMRTATEWCASNRSRKSEVKYHGS